MFITFEGVDGAGKSTQVRLLAEQLRAEGRQVLETREPGGTALGEKVRDVILAVGSLAPWAEALLFAAARAQLVDEVIRPALARGEDVLSDRYIDSSLAYQGLARGLGVERVLVLNLAATGHLLPDRTFLIEVPLDQAARQRGNDPDRIEQEGDEFLEHVNSAYQDLAGIFAQRIVTVDGSQPASEVAKLIRGQLRDLS
jgi:dTMP kinase